MSDGRERNLKRIITAVSLNPAIDRTITVPGFTPGATNRVQISRTDPGGKGINVARVVRALGGSARVVGFLGRENGEVHTRYLSELGVDCRFIRVPGQTRVNIKIVDPVHGGLTEINDRGFSVTPVHNEELRAQVERALDDSAVLVLSGSLPTGAPSTIYRDLIERAAAAGVPAILDADGEALSEALSARTAVIKPNQAEAERLLGRRLPTPEAVIEAARELLRLGPQAVVISCGADGAVLARPEGCWWATPPSITPGSTVGAGDSMVAALALAMAREMPPEEALRLATAAGTATARMEGTRVCAAEDVEALLPQVTLQSITTLNKG